MARRISGKTIGIVIGAFALGTISGTGTGEKVISALEEIFLVKEAHAYKNREVRKCIDGVEYFAASYGGTFGYMSVMLDRNNEVFHC